MTSSGMVVPKARQGPGHLHPAAVARLDVTLARRTGGLLPGESRSLGVGTGTELVQLRAYEPGDDLRHLDPAASARTSVPHVRQHVPERTRTTWIVLDISPSMAFGSADRLKCDVAEGVALVLSAVAVRRGGRLGVMTAGATRQRVLPPRSGRGAIAGLRRLLDEGVAADGAAPRSTLAGSLRRLRGFARTPGVVVVVSDLRDEGWQRPLRELAARHSVLAVEIGDPLEAALPDAGTLVVVDPETGAEITADTSSPQVRQAFADAEADRRASVTAALRHAGVGQVTLSTEGDWLRELARTLR